MPTIHHTSRLALLALLFLFSGMRYSAAGSEAGEILVKLRDPASLEIKETVAIGHGVFLLSTAAHARGFAGRSPTLDAQLANWQADPDVLYAEPNYPGYFADFPAALPAPNDPEFASQSWLAAVGARQAWAVATGQGITVAVIDSGVDMAHPDLRDNLRNDGFSTGDNTANPQDRVGHGTFVAGIVAAQRNNARAGSGLAPEAKILPIKVSPGAEKTFSSAALAQAIDYAVSHGAHVINLSLVAVSATRTVADAIDRALAAGSVVVAAAGNTGGDVAFPATHPGVIGVAGANAAGQLMTSSNFGPQITVAAPGIGLTSTLLGGGFGENGFGTSHAAPIVAATVAHLLQLDQRFDAITLAEIIKSTAKPLAGPPNPNAPFGHLDTGKAVQALLPDLPLRTSSANSTLGVDFMLPRTAGAVDINVSIATPFGHINLLPNLSWQLVATADQTPLARGYRAVKPLTGTLFGNQGFFPLIDVTMLPAGVYDFKIALTATDSGKPIGPAISSRHEIQRTGPAPDHIALQQHLPTRQKQP